MRLQYKTVYVDTATFSAYIYRFQNTSNAYAMTCLRSRNLLEMVNAETPIFRAMKETLAFAHVAYKIPAGSPNQAAVNVAIQRTIESGLYDMFVKWSLRYFFTLHKPLLQTNVAAGAQPVGVTLLAVVFYLHAINVAIALVVFGMELAWKWKQERRELRLIRERFVW